MFDGVSVALVTPFRKGGVDYDALDRLVDHVLQGGVDGLVPMGSTGEAGALTPEERREILARVKARAAGRAFIVPGTGSHSTRTTIEQTRQAAGGGADGAMVVVPPYVKPTAAGQIAHFRAVADASEIPLILYNVPGRTGASMSSATALELAGHPRIRAIKEASGSLDQASRILRGGGLTLLSGEDSLTLPLMSIGAAGVVSVAGNLFPAAMVSLVRAARDGDLRRARSLHLALTPLFEALFIESNPLPVKRALAGLGLVAEEFRLPLVPMGAETGERLDRVVAEVRADLERLGDAVP